MRTVAALYVDPLGPYPSMPGVDCWDESRDAKLYDGPHPVVAHPPCGPWGRMKFLCTKQDPDCGLMAIEQVKRFGGVLEHPAGSQLFKRCGVPSSELVEVRQVSWGHRCEKPTWLWIVGVERSVVESGIRTGGVATHRVTNGSRGKTHLPRESNIGNRLTPPAFAEWLISLARSASP